MNRGDLLMKGGGDETLRQLTTPAGKPKISQTQRMTIMPRNTRDRHRSREEINIAATVARLEALAYSPASSPALK